MDPHHHEHTTNVKYISRIRRVLDVGKYCTCDDVFCVSGGMVHVTILYIGSVQSDSTRGG
jgi:hypothetical protein